MLRVQTAVLFALVGVLAGCAPAIGDDCDVSIDCSVSGERLCDIASPGGYCTIQNCDQDSCPDGAVCVEYLFDPERTSQSWCMAACESKGDCRGSYACTKASQIVDEKGTALARVIDKAGDKKKFCAINEP